MLEQANPTKAGKDERRDAIVAVAKEVFAVNGYAGTSMSHVAARVGGSKATLYSYFKSKEELFAAVVEEMRKDRQAVERCADRQRRRSKSGDHPFRGALRRAYSERRVGRNFPVGHSRGRAFPEIGQTIYNSGIRQNQRRIADFLEQAKDAGQLRSDTDVLSAAEQFTDLCLSGIHRRCLWNVPPPPGDDEIRANVARAVETFMRAYAAT